MSTTTYESTPQATYGMGDDLILQVHTHGPARSMTVLWVGLRGDKFYANSQGSVTSGDGQEHPWGCSGEGVALAALVQGF